MKGTKLRPITPMVRQGDVLLVRVDVVPEGARRIARRGKRLVLELGEATGHAHAITAKDVSLLEIAGETYLVIGGDAVKLLHEEHSEIVLPPGAFQRGFQVEEEGEAVRPVAD